MARFQCTDYETGIGSLIPGWGPKGDFHANDFADCPAATRIWRRRWLLRISQMGSRVRHRDFRAGPDHRGAGLRLRRNSSALKKSSGLVLEPKRNL
jgi:hypothetical protein